MSKPWTVIISCEHASRALPPEWVKIVGTEVQRRGSVGTEGQRRGSVGTEVQRHKGTESEGWKTEGRGQKAEVGGGVGTESDLRQGSAGASPASLPQIGQAGHAPFEHGSAGDSPASFPQIGQAGHAPLEEHRWWDPGAKTIASALGSRLLCPIFFGHYSRLLIDLNRSPENPQRWSEFTQSLTAEEKKLIEDTCYWPYWSRVHQTVAHKLSAGNRVLHLSIHSFTPVLNGAVRTMDMGLLFDPSRELEVCFCNDWGAQLTAALPAMTVAHNEPYRGTDDGLTTYLRHRFADTDYAGVEFELNFKHVHSDTWNETAERIVEATVKAVGRQLGTAGHLHRE
ncbi:MAG: N-formylglutamate amidohydrolase [Verrucomicrobiota bacterium]|nr:N-formylglutamate amidohydrolase [Verrucomicrobiota bacterium]